MTTDLPADQYYLYVLALSRQVTLTQLVDALAERLGPLQLVELVTVPAPAAPVPPPPPWWHALNTGDRVRPARAGVPVLYASGQPWRRMGDPAGITWDVYGPPDLASGRVCVFDRSRFGGGLWVSANDIERV